MNYCDRMILEFFNRFSQRSWTFDNVIAFLCGTDLLKGGIVVGILWTLWFARGEEEAVAETRRTVVATFAGSFVALFITKILANTFPFRLRPMHEPALNFRLPFGISPGTLEGWSAFPSDHATLFSGLVTGIFLISRRLGFFSIVYTFLVILIPRIYLGFHYPTDILAGIFLGCVCVLLANLSLIKNKVTDLPMEWSEKYPLLFIFLFFLLSYETVVLFGDVRYLVNNLMYIAIKILHRFS